MSLIKTKTGFNGIYDVSMNFIVHFTTLKLFSTSH
jgi:hypothetical protein